MPNYCSNCREVWTLGNSSCSKCGWSPEEEENSDKGDGMPTLSALKGELASMLRGFNKPLPAPFSVDILQSVDQWVRMQDPHDKFDAPYRPKKAWAWPYADRLKGNLKKYLQIDVEFQGLIISAAEDGIFWRGEDRNFFNLVIDEALTLRETTLDEYKAGAREQYRQAKSGFKISRAMHPCTKTASGKHEWIDRVGKNAGAPMQCVLCNRLLTELQIKPMARRG